MPASLLRRLGAAAFALALLPLFAGCDSGDSGAETTVTVMTRNLYLGGDLFDLLDPSCEGDAIVACVGQLYFGSVVPSDIPGRMDAVAAEIEANAPDLVGLQEVSLYRTQTPSDFLTGHTEPNATNVAYDYLQLLMDALEARGLDYEVAATNENADVEFPGTIDGTTFTDIRLTDRDVILKRAGLQTSVIREANYDRAFTAIVTVGGIEVAFTRGYSAISVTKDGVDFTFANTHLEVGGAAALAQRAQAGILTSPSVLGDAEPLILVGDFNSNPDPEDDPDQEDAYRILTDTFTDTWARLRSSDPGFTCCQAANLRNPTSQLSERIDLVFFDGDVQPVTIGLVGNDPSDRTSTGVWPSDHAGVVATLTDEG